MVPGTRVPEWFDHITKGEYMTFWVRKKFPAIILCFALAIESKMKKSFNCEIRFYINSDEVYELEIPIMFSELVTDHVWLSDLRTHPSIRLNDIESYLVDDDWNQIEISCKKVIGPSNMTISWCGVHVCKQEANMEDILFEDPYLDSDLSIETENIDPDNIDNIAECHNDIDHNQEKILLHTKTLDGVTEVSKDIVCFDGTNVVRGKNQLFLIDCLLSAKKKGTRLDNFSLPCLI
jgi:hypothetical protein